MVMNPEGAEGTEGGGADRSEDQKRLDALYHRWVKEEYIIEVEDDYDEPSWMRELSGSAEVKALGLDLSGEHSLTLLRALHSLVGEERLAANMGASVGLLQSLMSGELEVKPDLRAWLEEYVNNLHGAGLLAGVERYREAAASGGAPAVVGTPGAIALQAVEEGPPEEQERLQSLFPDGDDRVLPPPPLSDQDRQRERMRYSLWNARFLAVVSQFRMNLSPADRYTVMSVVMQLEMCLIMYFGDTPPESGATWDAARRNREVEQRLHRMRWLEQKASETERGLRGMWNWVKGNRRLSGKELFDEMVRLADAEIAGEEIGPGHVQLMMEGNMDQVANYVLRRGGFSM